MKKLPPIVMSLVVLAALAIPVAKTLAADLPPPLAGILAEEIRLVAGLKLAVAAGKPGQGDIALAIDPGLALNYAE
jgi:hypothetical protein